MHTTRRACKLAFAAVIFPAAAYGQSSFVALTEIGFGCKELASAKTHEALRTKKNATPYEIAAAMQLPGCEQIDSPGLRLWVVSTDDSGAFLRVEHPSGGRYDPRWIPKRMTKPAQ